MHDLAVWTGHSEEFFRTEGLLVEVNGLSRASNRKVRGNVAVAIGNWFYLIFHHYLLRG